VRQLRRNSTGDVPYRLAEEDPDDRPLFLADWKRQEVVILLEECGLPYTIKPINIGRGDQLTPDFLKISPNGRMPAIVDHEPMGGGAPISIFESGAIMTYLAEKTGRFCPSEPRKKYDVAQWVSWQLANQGPKLGEQGHFRRALEAGNNGDLAYAISRFDNEDAPHLRGYEPRPVQQAVSCRRRIHDCRRDLLPLGIELGEPEGSLPPLPSTESITTA
jgi:hypothetical protein